MRENKDRETRKEVLEKQEKIQQKEYKNHVNYWDHSWQRHLRKTAKALATKVASGIQLISTNSSIP